MADSKRNINKRQRELPVHNDEARELRDAIISIIENTNDIRVLQSTLTHIQCVCRTIR